MIKKQQNLRKEDKSKKLYLFHNYKPLQIYKI